MRHKYTDEDIEFLKHYYPIADWKAISDRFPNVTPQGIKSKMSKLGIHVNDRYAKQHTTFKRKVWTSDEDALLIENYSNKTMDQIQELFPDRTLNSIKNRAVKFGLISYERIKSSWEQYELDYITRNWELMPDLIMAQNLGRTRRAVKAKREELGFYRRDMNSNTYPSLSKYLRGQNQRWKTESMKQCDYKCVLTGTKDFEIHHLFGVSNIIERIFNENTNIKRHESFDDYDESELSFILDKFLEIQNEYPLGECISKDLHKKFHSMYGQYYNTPEQWYQFKKDYIGGLYNNQ